ncbi:MAG: threonine/serine exporter [Ruminococcaceae bacterium]|nr:threonine/serine exporter [Oscillospiraceae bacterium]
MNWDFIINLIVQFTVCSVASAAFAIFYTPPFRHLIWAGITGGFGWVIYVIFANYGVDAGFSSFFATVAVTALSRSLAFHRKAPITIFLIPGIIPLVPGIAIYQTGYYMFMSESSKAISYAASTFSIAIAIALGMALTLSLPQVFFSFKRKKNL